MHRLEAAFLLVLVLSTGSVAYAQTNPMNVRDGCVTGTVPLGEGNHDVDLFTVPTGMDFVLTDVQQDVSFSIPPVVVDETGTLRWLPLPYYDGSNKNLRNRSWTTGIRFTAGQIVRMRFVRTIASQYLYTICWAGHVSPSGTSSVGDGGDERLGFKLGPNPTSGGATVWFRLDRAGPVTLAIYDAQGRLIHGQKFEQMQAGERSVRWDGRDLNGKKAASGVYFARLEAPGEKRGAKLVRVD